MFGLPIEVVLSIVSLLMGFFAESKKQQAQDLHEERLAATNSANAASKRGGSTLRLLVAMIVMIVAFGGLIYAAYAKIPVTQFIEKEPWLNLFGLIKLGGGMTAETATGFVVPDYVKYSVISIVHFIFGMAAGKR